MIQLNEENMKTQALLKALHILNKPIPNPPNPNTKNIET